MQANKVIRDDKVAVLYSPGYGAGWSTWDDDKSCLFDPLIVEWVENGKTGEIPIENLHELFYLGGADQLEIEWIPVGTLFRIEEYAGSESIKYLSETDWVIA